ncbi:MAG: helix-turn-helix transcriptional regulator [Bacteroidales bacterium]|nr:helix-turn-helix transcriptional regulator [Bacteroidales bacterium]
MEILKIILLILAYTLGIATLIVQIVCFLKDLEYKETILFTIVFLCLIIASTFQSFVKTENSLLLDIQELATNILTLAFAISIPINIHKERVDKYRKIRNNIVITIGTIVTILVIMMHSFNDSILAILIVSIHLLLTVVYSMFFLLFTKPGVLIQFREKSERKIAIIVLIIMIFTSILFIVTAENFDLKQIQQNGGIILAIICIVLSVSKIPGDIKKLLQSEKTFTPDDNKLEKLGITQREQDVLKLLITGKTYNEMAAELFISLPTVKTHVSNIYSKANVRNRLELSNLINAFPVNQ